MAKHRHTPREVAEIVAIQALSFVAGEPERLGLFLAESGIGPETLRSAAADPRFLASVLDFVLLPARLHLQEGDERAHLLLDRLEPDQRVELGLQLVEAPLRLLLQRAQLLGELVADGLPDAFAERLQRLGGILEWVSAHERSMLVAGGKEGRCGSTYLWARC